MLLPATRESDIIGLQNSEGILELRDTLKDSISVASDDKGFTVTAQSTEKYHGEDSTMKYSCSYTVGRDSTVFGVNKAASLEKGPRQSIVVTKTNGQIASLEETQEGYLKDSDNYYFKSYRDPGDGFVHVICGKTKRETGEYDISYVDKNLGVHSYESSIAKQLYEKGISSATKEGQKMISTISSKIKASLVDAKEMLI